MSERARRALTRAGGWLIKNIWYRVTAVVLAVLIWASMKVGNDFMRTKIVEIPVSNISVLGYQNIADNQLISVDYDLNELLPSGVRVTVRVPNRNYAVVDAGSFSAQLNMNTNLTLGEQTLPLMVTVTSFSSEARIISYSPEEITFHLDRLLTVELPIDTASAVMVNGKLVDVEQLEDETVGDEIMSEDMWVSGSRDQSAKTVRVSGPESVVSRIRRARATIDITGAKKTVQQLCDVELYAEDGSRVTSPGLTVDPPRVTLEQGVYPIKEVPLRVDVVGNVLVDYEVVEVIPSVSRVNIIADQQLLDTIDQVDTQQVLIEGASRSFVTTVRVRDPQGVDGMFATDPAEVQVTVKIAEITDVKEFTNLPVKIEGGEPGLSYELSPARTDIRVSGPRSIIRKLKSSDITLYVDVGGVMPGERSLPIAADAEALEQLMIVPSNIIINVTTRGEE